MKILFLKRPGELWGKTVLCGFLWLCFSCRFVSFESESVKVVPGSGDAFFCGEQAAVFFENEVEKHSAEEAVCLKAENCECAVELVWEGERVLKIRPEEGWVKGKLYQLEVNGNILKSGGNSFSVYEKACFFYGAEPEDLKNREGVEAEDFENKFVLVSAPFETENLGSCEPLVFEFSQPVGKAEFLNAFCLEPSADFLVEAGQENTVFCLVPLKNWKVNVCYRWSFKNLVSRENWILQKNTEGCFSAGTELTRPELLTVCPVVFDFESGCSVEGGNWLTNLCLDQNLPMNGGIGFVFSRPMNFSSVKEQISFSPSVSGVFLKSEDETKFIFLPKENYKTGTQYLLKAGEKLEDKNGIHLSETYKEFFCPAEKFLKVNSIIIGEKKFDFEEESGEAGEILGAERFADEAFEIPLKSDFAGQTEMTVSVLFSENIEENFLSEVEKNVSLTVLFPASAAVPAKTAVRWNSERKMLTLTWKKMSTSTEDFENFYRLTLSGGKNGIETGRGNCLEEDLCLVLKFTL